MHQSKAHDFDRGLFASVSIHFPTLRRHENNGFRDVSLGKLGQKTRDRCATFSYPEPILRAVNGARQGALAKSISNWHLIGHNEGCCSNTGYILLPCFYGIRLWIWPEPLVAPRVRRALGTRMDAPLMHFSPQRDVHSRTQSPSYARRDEGLWPNP